MRGFFFGRNLRSTVFGMSCGIGLGLVLAFAGGTSEARPAARIVRLDAAETTAKPAPRPAAAPTPEEASPERRIVERARADLVNVKVYDRGWLETDGFPGGDIPADHGACTDVVVRALRAAGLDLQEAVHDDMLSDMKAYGAKRTDVHIDHRRVGTMFTYFRRHATSLTTSAREKDAFRPGDVVFYDTAHPRTGAPSHVAIVSDRIGPRGLPLVIQNGGGKRVENDALDHGRMVGHFRIATR